eukprot:scaffold12186_cov89-Cylindrotheca_fusiformis.AAC.1
MKTGDLLVSGMKTQCWIQGSQYEVELPDGSTDEYFANTIAENIYAQVDSEGREQAIVKEIIDHKSDGNAIPKSQGFFRTSSGNMRPKRTTSGWK